MVLESSSSLHEAMNPQEWLPEDGLCSLCPSVPSLQASSTRPECSIMQEIEEERSQCLAELTWDNQTSGMATLPALPGQQNHIPQPPSCLVLPISQPFWCWSKDSSSCSSGARGIGASKVQFRVPAALQVPLQPPSWENLTEVSQRV